MQCAYHITRAAISQASSDIVLRYLEIPDSGISEFRQTCVFMEILTSQPFRQNPVSRGCVVHRLASRARVPSINAIDCRLWIDFRTFPRISNDTHHRDTRLLWKFICLCYRYSSQRAPRDSSIRLQLDKIAFGVFCLINQKRSREKRMELRLIISSSVEFVFACSV